MNEASSLRRDFDGYSDEVAGIVTPFTAWPTSSRAVQSAVTSTPPFIPPRIERGFQLNGVKGNDADMANIQGNSGTLSYSEPLI